MDHNSNRVTVALAGLSGYGNFYLNQLLTPEAESKMRLVGCIDPYVEQSAYLPDLKQARIPIFSSLEDFYRHGSADLVILAVPIHLHAPLTCLALAHGSNVLCEKPLAGGLDDARRMRTAEQQAGKFVAIGYQWSFSGAILSLKQDILVGRFGRPLALKTMALWPRHRQYYQRNPWAGRIQSEDGAWILDSPVNNATAHYFHNMLFLLGDAIHLSARPIKLEAELYRANPIENYDTGVLRVEIQNGAHALFITSHAVPDEIGPRMHFEFENGVVEYPVNENEFQARFKDGTLVNYGSPDTTQTNKIWHSIEAVRAHTPIACGIQTAYPHLACVVGAQKAGIHPFPENLIKTTGEDEDRLVWVEGLAESLSQCYQTGQMPSEIGAAWSVPSVKIEMSQF